MNKKLKKPNKKADKVKRFDISRIDIIMPKLYGLLNYWVRYNLLHNYFFDYKMINLFFKLKNYEIYH